MDMPDPTTPLLAGGAVALIALFVASGKLAGNEEGGDLWAWIKRSARRKRAEGA